MCNRSKHMMHQEELQPKTTKKAVAMISFLDQDILKMYIKG
jgi:hypothetical protein